MRGVLARTIAVAALFTPSAAAQIPALVSQTPGGVSGNGWSVTPVMSADGSTIAFVSQASDLVDGDTNNVTDVFVRRLLSATTERVSVASDGTQANSPSNTCPPSLSADGRSVAFDTAFNPLISTTGVYVHDRMLVRTILLPVPAEASPLTRRPAISADGRFVAFMSYTRGSVPGIPYDDRVLLFDRELGTSRSLARTGSFSDDVDAAGAPSISADGQWVAFASSLSLAGTDTNRTFDVFLHDTVVGSTRLVSTTGTGVAGVDSRLG